MPPLEFKRRIRLPDGLPEVEFAPTRRRTRGTILLVGSLAWALATAAGWWLLERRSAPGEPSLAIGGAPTHTPPSPAPALPSRALTRRALPASAHSTGIVGPAPLLPGCEEALSSADAELTQSDWALPRDMTESDYGALLDGSTARATLKHCAGTRAYRVELCVTVLGVKAVGVSAATEPENAAVSACLNRSIGTMRFPHQPRPHLLRSRITL